MNALYSTSTSHDLENKPAWNFCLPENRWRMEDGWHGKDTMEIIGEER